MTQKKEVNNTSSTIQLPKKTNSKKKVSRALACVNEPTLWDYYSPYMNQAQINGSRGKSSRNYDDLSVEEQEAYSTLAKNYRNEENGIALFDSHGERIQLPKTKRYIILRLQEIYNEQISNNSDFTKDDWMRDDTGGYGRVYISAYELTCRIYNTNKPGTKVNKIAKHLRELGGKLSEEEKVTAEKYKYYLVYKEFDKKKGKYVTFAMWDNLLKLGVKIHGKDHDTGDNREAVGVIKLHDAFFSDLRRKPIQTKPTGAKLFEYFGNKIPSDAAMSLDGMLKSEGSQNHFIVKRRASYVLDTLAPELFRAGHVKQAIDMVQKAIDANKYSELLKDFTFEPGKTTGEYVYTFYINKEHFKNKALSKEDNTKPPDK